LFNHSFHVLLQSLFSFNFFFFSFPADICTPKSNAICYTHIENNDLNYKPEVEKRSLDVAALSSKEDDLGYKHSTHHVEEVDTQTSAQFS
jgi:hypothetical protein